MSRSNPTEDSPHPCKRWHEWDGARGIVRYYDKAKKENVDVPLPFTFVLLDKLMVIKGWHKKSDSGITSNEVKDIRSNELTVKAFKAGVIAEGFYSDIKEDVVAAGGHFTLNLYIAFFPNVVGDENKLEIGSLMLKGKALSDWMEFEKKNRKQIYEGAVKITDSYDGKKGNISFKVPVFSLQKLSSETNDQATDLDRELQGFLQQYFKRKTAAEPDEAPPPERREVEPDDDEIPF